jgi:hypothetical protein
MVERHQVRLALALRRWESEPLAIGITAVLCSLCTATDDPTPVARTLVRCDTLIASCRQRRINPST